MTTHPNPTIQVHGGAASLSATYSDLDTPGRLLTRIGGEFLPMAAELHRYLADPDVVASAVLDPVGAERFEQALLLALDGPHGLTWVSGELELTGAGLRLAVTVYSTADRALHDLQHWAEWGAGFVAGFAAIPMVLALAPDILAYEAFEKLTGRHDDQALEAALQTWVTEHTGFDQAFAGALPGLLTGVEDFLHLGLPLLPTIPITSLGQGSDLLSLYFKNGTGTASPIVGPWPSTAPTSVQGLLEDLDYADGQSQHYANSGGDAQITIERIVDSSGQVRYIVDMPGTTNWEPTVGDGHVACDLNGNINSMAGHDTAYEQAVVAAMKQAGITSTDPVMLVGHSQGGMVAAQVAADHTGTGGYNITHVITAGSPIANTKVPESVHVLSLENTHDVVPTLDGDDNATSANHVTVTFATQNGSVAGNHSITDAYTPAAGSVDASDDPSLAVWKQSVGGYLAPGVEATTTTYGVARVP